MSDLPPCAQTHHTIHIEGERFMVPATVRDLIESLRDKSFKCDKRPDYSYMPDTADFQSFMLRAMYGSNGETRCQPVRYGHHLCGCWYGVVALCEQPDANWIRWDNLVGGDIEYHDAEHWFRDHGADENLFLATGYSPGAALEAAMERALYHLSERTSVKEFIIGKLRDEARGEEVRLGRT